MEGLDLGNIMEYLEIPPKKNNFSIWDIIELIIMSIIGLMAGKELYDIFKLGTFSFIDLLKIFIDGLIFIGIIITIYGFFREENKYLKGGFLLFLIGLLGVLFLFILDIFKGGFRIGYFIEFLLYLLFAYIIYIQYPNV